jgi:hypothetical protein
MDTVEEKKFEKHNNQNDDEDINFLQNHKKLFLSNKGKKKETLQGDQLEVLNNFGENLDKYLQQIQFSKIRESRNEQKQEGLISGYSEKNIENKAFVSDEIITDRDVQFKNYQDK